MVAPGFSKQGLKTFHDFVSRFAFSRRPQERFALAALRQGELVGVIEVLEGHHVALFFVSPKLQGRGSGERSCAARWRSAARTPPAWTR